MATSASPTLLEIEKLGGRQPQDYSKRVAALALDAVRLQQRFDPFWSLNAGGRWYVKTQFGCPESHPWRYTCNQSMERMTLVARSRNMTIDDLLHVVLEENGLPEVMQDYMPDVWPQPVGYRKLFTRGPIPVSLYSCLAILRSGGDPAYVRTSPVVVGGIFAVPLEVAKVAGFNPWSVRDSLVFTRNLVEGVVRAWKTGEVPSPKCSTYRDLLYSALVRWIVGERVAAILFQALDRTGVSPSTVAQLGTVGGGVDWSSETMRLAGGRDQVLAGCQSVAEALEAMELIEGFPYASDIGLTSAGRDVVPEPRRFESIVWSHPYSEVSGSDPMRASENPHVSLQLSTSSDWLWNTASPLRPWEGSDYQENQDRWGVDAWQRKQFLDVGHYPTRAAVIEALAPAYIGGSALARANRPPGREQRAWVARHPVAAAGIGLGVAATVAVIAVAVARRKK